MIKYMENGFAYVEVSNAVSSAKIALQGAHIYEYTRKSADELLWLSPTSSFERGKAIRGGIPICWPRFGVEDKSMPAHGFTRTAMFSLVSIKELDTESTEVVLRLQESEESCLIWDYKFTLEVVFTISESLEVKMITTNTDTKPFLLTEALHIYLHVSHIDDVKVEGLQNRAYLDTLDGKIKSESGTLLIDKECDRVYQDFKGELVLVDKEKTLSLQTKGSESTVVWNPWIEKGSSMSGMQADAYKEFICLETANAFKNALRLQPKEVHSMSVILLGLTNHH